MLGEKLQVVANNVIAADRNLTSIKFSNQEDAPELPPDTEAIVERSYIAIDNNYLYIWLDSLKKWKRTPLSEW